MGVGALLIAPFGDKIGRRKTVLLSLGILFTGMLAASFTNNVFELGLVRAFTGLGIGAVLANVNILVSEYSSPRRRNLCVALMSVGYPIGATIGGIAAVYLLEIWGWRSVYVFGALIALVLVPITLFFLPESLDFLVARRPGGALARSNRIFARLGLRQIVALPPVTQIIPGQRASAFAIFRPQFLSVTLVTSFLYLSVMATCYFLLSWTPKLLIDLGLSVRGGISGSLLLNVGGAIGCILFGLYAVRLGVRRLATGFMLGLVAMTVLFGFIPPVQGLLLTGAMAVGFCLHTSITVLYVVVPTVFPGAIRATRPGGLLASARSTHSSVFGPKVRSTAASSSASASEIGSTLWKTNIFSASASSSISLTTSRGTRRLSRTPIRSGVSSPTSTQACWTTPNSLSSTMYSRPLPASLTSSVPGPPMPSKRARNARMVRPSGRPRRAAPAPETPRQADPRRS